MVKSYESQSKLRISICCIIVIDPIPGHFVASVSSFDSVKLHNSSSESTHRPFQKSMVLASFNKTRSCLKIGHLVNPRQENMFRRSTRENLPTPPTVDNREKTVVREWHLPKDLVQGPSTTVCGEGPFLLCTFAYLPTPGFLSRLALQIDSNRLKSTQMLSSGATLAYIEIPR